MTPQAFRHVPELAQRLVPPLAGGLRLTDEVLAAWDEQARAQGLPDSWRWPTAVIEASQRDLLGDWHGDLWVFAYGSLMWNPGIHFAEIRRARLPGHARHFGLGTTIGRGTPEAPGLVLTLQADPHASSPCEGLVFRIEGQRVQEESRLLWRREMITGGYRPLLLPLHTPQGQVHALVLTANPQHPHHYGHLSLHETAAIIARAGGTLGSNRDYLEQLLAQCEVLGIHDPYLHALAEQVQRLG